MNEVEPTSPVTMSASARRVWLGLGVVITMSALLFGGMGVISVGWAALQRASVETSSENHSYAGKASNVEVQSARGMIVLTGTDSDGIDTSHELTWSGPEPDVDEAMVGETFTVDVGCPEPFPQWISHVCSVDYTAQIPADADVDVSTTTAPIEVRDVDGGLALMSTTGPLTVDAASGPLRAHVTTGDIIGSGLRSAQVDAEVVTGSVALSFTTPPERVLAMVTTGDVTIEVPRTGGPYRVEVDTTTGEQHVDVAQDPEAEPDRVIDVTTTTGDVHVRYPT